MLASCGRRSVYAGILVYPEAVHRAEHALLHSLTLDPMSLHYFAAILGGFGVKMIKHGDGRRINFQMTRL